MTKKYFPKDFEKKWQKKWRENGVYATDLSKPNKYYVLAEYAYPSGDLHMGHWFTWSGADIFARFKRMQGYNVFFPNGFDSFGLPAEGAAIKRGIHPQDWTEQNIARMKQQYQTMGPSFDFYGDLASHKPEYYKWNQWIFLKMFEKGIAYKGKYLSNWCPIDQTVLANEAVEGGKCWRCGSEVIQKEIEQWFFKITEYAERLIWPENPSASWPVSVRTAQNEWIGRSEGCEIKFEIAASPSAPRNGVIASETKQFITVYTVYPETIFGVTYMVLAPENKLVEKITTKEQKEKVSKYIKTTQLKSELERKEANKEKTGVFTGAYCINPVNNKKVPIWIADYVIASYGTGAVMGVPGSDHRDFEFAKKYDLEIIRVIGKSSEDKGKVESANDVLEEGVLVNSEQFNGLNTPIPARDKIKNYLEEKGWGKKARQYHIHDWSVSRQRYWGTPIPMIHCPECGIMPVPESDLPVLLPYDVDFQPKGIPPLASNKEWLNVKCPKCGGPAEREAETMDTFVDSSWYFFRFLDTEYDQGPFSKALASKIMPVDIYFGGAEHTLGHTLYSRFFTKFFYDLSLCDIEEYALRRINHGTILGPDGTKMSKSRPDSVVNPDEEVKKYGADTIRLYLAFLMPYEATGPWDRERVNGPYRFLQRVWGLIDKVTADSGHPEERSDEGSVSDPVVSSEMRNPSKKQQIPRQARDDNEPNSANSGMTDQDLREMNRTIKAVTQDLEAVKFNTAVASLMQWLNYLSSKEKVAIGEYKNLLILLGPFAPHITEELWSSFAKASDDESSDSWSIHQQSWPKFDDKFLEQEEIIIVIQVNGKVRDNFKLSKNISEKEVIEIAKTSEKVKKFLTGEMKKTIFVPGKLLNIVI